MHKQHPQTAYRKDAVLIGTIFENCDTCTEHAVLMIPSAGGNCKCGSAGLRSLPQSGCSCSTFSAAKQAEKAGVRHAQHQKQNDEGKQHPDDDVHLVDREGEFIVELFLGVDEIRVVVVQQSLFLSALWALAAASSACSFSSWASRWASSASRRASSSSRWVWFVSAMVVSSGVFSTSIP